ncbi:serine O-acetyltransferase [Methylocella silvestris BL2]|uniref:Serine acetyltransferase n=1 Tax=Methylocella silvestris (strain DSM 15510 / CIP 108128 / LMG 27833 / NCIMB 13906 / BL2) TaxID=395965 RepID=B8EJ11_METSB|nr:serine O-acetyltransferase [Methylocella silvestris]ACK52503.1 serine O-acetyltransferase [Methylocella silvestris BL2]
MSVVAIEHTTAAPKSLWRMIRDDVACVHQRDPAARNTAEVALLYPGVHAIVLHRISHGLWTAKHKFLARLLSFTARFLTNVDIHPGASIGERFFIDHGAGVVIGETAIVGDDVTLYHGVTLGGSSWSPGKRHPTLEDGVLVGAGAKILGDITVGRNARIGANSVVIEDVAPEATVVGIPGQIVRKARPRSGPGGRIDLEHHLITNPVADAMSIMIDRIDFLETRLAHLQQKVGASLADKGRPQIQTEDQTS